ncbi:hypothetical protein H4N54_05995 [Limnospira fusiformis KN01]|uniref:hypothetical protein n=1 Tax=Limnospira TaxID=2596745 RepID=UPI0002803E38|nr:MULTISPECIES: hypothetical protein [Limnospira]EKD07645.1 hypothetical protein SPLC1_S370210 [Arthrospira platensis C1]MDC0838720.1 hypothetical protein [Limnoraphis robusta]MDT9201081.1 hypothetical protein [Limnospira sp. PMC 1042.18]ULB46895.1 hypothetical protein H4N54_05995 [Limnospira fusiformis KN01]
MVTDGEGNCQGLGGNEARLRVLNKKSIFVGGYGVLVPNRRSLQRLDRNFVS